MAYNAVVEMTEAETLKRILVPIDTINWLKSFQESGTVEDFGLRRANATKTAFKEFPVSGKLPSVSQLSLQGENGTIEIRVIHSWNDIKMAAAGTTNLYMNETVRKGFFAAIEETKRETSRPLVTRGLMTKAAQRFDDETLDPVPRTAHEILIAFLYGGPLDGIALPAAQPDNPTDAIVKSAYPPTLLNPNP